MTIETALYPNQLNATLPPQSDIVREGAGHLRLLKTVVKTTFPNVAGAVSASNTELSYVTGVTSGIQAQINAKGAIAGQAWTGTHSFPNTTTVGPLTPTIQGYLSTATSDVQAQINAKGAIAGQTWTGAHVFNGTATLPAATTIGAVTAAELAHLSGVTSPIQTQFAAKASLSGATYTGAHDYSGASSVTLPAATSIGSITSTELGYVDGVTAPIQGQLDSKADITGESYTGTHDFTGGALKAPTMTAGTATTDVATTAFVASAALSTALPGQTGNAGKVISTDGTNASWVNPVFPEPYTDIAVNTTAVPYVPYRLTASLDLTLPPAPTDGDWVDVVNTSGTTTARVLRNGQNINGLAEDLTLDKQWIALRFVFRTGYGWIIT